MALVAVLSLAVLATIGVHPHWSPDGRAANDALLVGFGLSGAAVAFTRYRSTRNTHPLFVGAALLTVAVQTLLFDQHWILSPTDPPWEGISFAVARMVHRGGWSPASRSSSPGRGGTDAAAGRSARRSSS